MLEKSEVRSEKSGAGPHSLLAVFAHPDDESLACGGLLAWCAALGMRVSLLAVTHGEHGQMDDTKGTDGTPPPRDVRATELRDAASVLGIEEVTILDHEDGMLPWVDAEQLETDIRDAIQRLGPDVVITFGDDGLYGHPDHIAVYERTTAAIAALGDDAPALYYVTIPAGAMRAIVNHAANVTARRDPDAVPPYAILGIVDADAFGALAAAPTLVVETGEFAASKLRALTCHRSQFRDCALALVDANDAPRLLGAEHYRRADVGARGDTFIDRFAAPRTPVRRNPAQT